MTGRVTSVEKVSDLQLVVRSQGETKTVDLGDPEEKDGLFYYRLGHQTYLKVPRSTAKYPEVP